MAGKWSVSNLADDAVGVSASRRTDIPALFAKWFRKRVEEGFAESVPLGPFRRIRRSLRPEAVTHFNFWTKWPRPFLPVLEKVLQAGYPVLWNVTVTGMGGSALEPGVPAADRAVESVKELARLVRPEAILWRYDPIVLTEKLGVEHHAEAFARLADSLAGSVDRVATSFIVPYERIKGNLRRHGRQSGDRFLLPGREDGPALRLEDKIDIFGRLREIAMERGMELTVCCDPRLRQAAGCSKSGCNAWSWACRAYPELEGFKPLRPKPTRDDCGCSLEFDIGVYDTCTLGCVYSYGTASLTKCERNRRAHDPGGTCLI